MSVSDRSAGIPRLISLVLFILLVPLVLPLTATQADAPPAASHRFYGTVANNDALVGQGYVVEAHIGATTVAATVTDAEGRYGYATPFAVNGTAGSRIQFSINDTPALQSATLQAGASTQLNLTAYNCAAQQPQTTCGLSARVLPTGTVGKPYSTALQTSGGVQPYTWSIASGEIPQGLVLDSASGVISGMPTAYGSFSFQVRVDDSSRHFQVSSATMQVNAGSAGTQPLSFPVSQPGPVAPQVTSTFLGRAIALPVSNGVLGQAVELASADQRVRLSLAGGTLLDLRGQSQIGAANETNPPPSNDGSFCARSYSFTPAGAAFSPACTMTLAYELPLPAGISESTLYIAYWDGTAWQRLDSAVDATAREVSARVAHFTIFAIRGTAAAPEPSPAPPPEDAWQEGSAAGDAEDSPAISIPNPTGAPPVQPPANGSPAAAPASAPSSQASVPPSSQGSAAAGATGFTSSVERAVTGAWAAVEAEGLELPVVGFVFAVGIALVCLVAVSVFRRR